MATLFKRLLWLGHERVLGVELEDEDGIGHAIVTVGADPRAATYLKARRASNATGRAPKDPAGAGRS